MVYWKVYFGYFGIPLPPPPPVYPKKRCCAFYHPRIKSVLQQIRLLQAEFLLTFDWIKFRGSQAIHRGVTSFVAKQVCIGPLKRATCTDFVTKSRTSLYFLQQVSITFQDRFDAWVVKRATPLLNSFCSYIDCEQSLFFFSRREKRGRPRLARGHLRVSGVLLVTKKKERLLVV